MALVAIQIRYRKSRSSRRVILEGCPEALLMDTKMSADPGGWVGARVSRGGSVRGGQGG